jgi:multicomponent Na+:H+ antiporter subunit A
MKLLYLVIGLFLLAVPAPFINQYLRRYSGWILSVVPALVFFWLLFQIPVIASGSVITEHYPWLSALGLAFTFTLDGLSLLFALLITGIGSLILIYAGYYMRPYENTNRFFGYLVFFMASMLGLVLSTNLISLFLFWELTSVSSFLLIGFNHQKQEARAAALQALLITGLGGLALLAGFILLSIPYGSFDLEVIFSNPMLIRESAFFIPALIGILIGAFTKSAIFPFHFWLPGAMQAPSPVSAYLHSATMVKAGVFLLARLTPLMDGSEIWNYTLSLFGATTMLVGAWFAIAQSDMKKILAYTTVSALGTLVLLVGTHTTYALNAFLIFVLVHAFYKATLFMMAGNIDKKTGTRELPMLGDLFRYMPVAAIISIIALLSMSGLPPMLGFIGKELIYEAQVSAPGAASVILILGFLANTFMVFVSGRLVWDVFFGERRNYLKEPIEPDISLLTGPAVLVGLSLLFGLFPNLIESSLVAPALSAMRPGTLPVNLKIWHGFNLVLLLSAITITCGGILFIFRKRVITMAEYLNRMVFSLRFSTLFFNLLNGFIGFTKTKTAFVQHGYHRFYLMTIFVVASLLVWFMISRVPATLVQLDELKSIPLFFIAVTLLIIIASLATIMASSRLISFISIGLVGFGIVSIFIWFSGVDLAITMIMVETLMVIIGAMVVYHLPKYMPRSSSMTRIRDAVVALFFGSFMTFLVIKTGSVTPLEKTSDFFTEGSYALGYGKNIVNVILVDFRALDTLGEVAVLVIAAIGVYALLRTGRGRKEKKS